MARVVWTPAALSDVARLYGFLAPKNPGAARRAAGTIRAGVRLLAIHPDIGRPVEGMAPEFREWFIPFGDSGYVVLYHADEALVAVLAVRHGREAGY